MEKMREEELKKKYGALFYFFKLTLFICKRNKKLLTSFRQRCFSCNFTTHIHAAIPLLDCFLLTLEICSGLREKFFKFFKEHLRTNISMEKMREEELKKKYSPLFYFFPLALFVCKRNKQLSTSFRQRCFLCNFATQIGAASHALNFFLLELKFFVLNLDRNDKRFSQY